MAAHVRLANVTDGKLVFLVDSPVWHARLRLASSELLDAVRSVGLDVREVSIKVTSMPLHPTEPKPVQVIPRSAAADEAFRTALASLDAPIDTGSGRRR